MEALWISMSCFPGLSMYCDANLPMWTWTLAFTIDLGLENFKATRKKTMHSTLKKQWPHTVTWRACHDQVRVSQTHVYRDYFVLEKIQAHNDFPSMFQKEKKAMIQSKFRLPKIVLSVALSLDECRSTAMSGRQTQHLQDNFLNPGANIHYTNSYSPNSWGA